MKAIMTMTMDTTWGNAVSLAVESELDNGHDLTSQELARLQVYTLSLMVAEVRRRDQYELSVRESHEVHPERYERHRFEAMERDTDMQDELRGKESSRRTPSTPSDG